MFQIFKKTFREKTINREKNLKFIFDPSFLYDHNENSVNGTQENHESIESDEEEITDNIIENLEKPIITEKPKEEKNEILEENLEKFLQKNEEKLTENFKKIEKNKNNVILEQNQEKKSIEEIKSLKELYYAIENSYEYTKNICEIKSEKTVIYSGNIESDLMIIGEAPGEEESNLKQPFVGRCGQFLDRMLKSINIDRNKVYVTNICFWRPPFNRAPTKDEISFCFPFVKKHIELKKPKVILCLGAVSLNLLLSTETISKVRGQKLKYEIFPNFFIDSMCTFHPAYILRMSHTEMMVNCVKSDLETLKELLILNNCYSNLLF